MLIDRETLERWLGLHAEHAGQLLPQPGVNVRCQMLTEGHPELTWFITFADGMYTASGLGLVDNPDCTLGLSLGALEGLMTDPAFDYLAAYIDGTMTFVAGSPEGAAGLSAIANTAGWFELMASLRDVTFGPD